MRTTYVPTTLPTAAERVHADCTAGAACTHPSHLGRRRAASRAAALRSAFRPRYGAPSWSAERHAERKAMGITV
jgi:hypothetical protein